MILSPCVFDIETGVISDVSDYAEDSVKVPARYTKPESIAKYIEESKQKQAEFAALDVDLLRIVAICWTFDGKKVSGAACSTEDAERKLIARFWQATMTRTYCGKNIKDFDLPALIRRSQYLGLTHPIVNIDRYRDQGVFDLQEYLTWKGKVRARTLDFYVRRFGLTAKVPKDPWKGSDVPTLVSAKDWPAVLHHCASDVRKEWALMEHLGLVQESDLTDNPF